MKRQAVSLTKKYTKHDEMKNSNSRKVIGFKSKDAKVEGEFLKNSPGRKQLGSEFKEIKDEISNIKGEIDQYFGEKMTNSCKKVEKEAGMGSPISLIQGSSPRLEVSIVSDAFSSSMSSNDENLYKIKFRLVSEELESMKRKYYLRKIEHKELITKLCKKISSLQKMAKNKDYDLQQYKRILGKEVTSIKQQINSCIQNQMTSTIIQTSREQLDYNHKMQFSQILNPEYETTTQVSKLHSLLNERDLILSQSQDELQKLKFQNLELQNLLESKQKSQLLLQQTLHQQYELTLHNLREQLKTDKLSLEDYRLRFEDLTKIRQLQYQETQDQEHYLRMELQKSLARESDCQNKFREIDRQRKEMNSKEKDVLRNELAKKNVELVEMKAEIKVRDEQISFLNKMLGEQFGQKKIKNEASNEVKELNSSFIVPETLKDIETAKLLQQNTELHEALTKTNATISELKSSYQQQLYSLQIQYRRKNVQYEDKLKQFMKMIGAEVSDLMLRQQDYQLVQKQQQLQRANMLLSQSQLRLCILQNELKTLHHSNFLSQLQPLHIHSTPLLQFQNNYLKLSIFSLCNKISILSIANQKKDQIILTKHQSNQSFLSLFKNLIVNVPDNFAEQFHDSIEMIKKLKEENRKLKIKESKGE